MPQDPASTPDTPPPGTAATGPARRWLVLGGSALAIALGLGVLYGTSGGWSNASAPGCAAARPVVKAMRPLARGDVAAVQVPKEPRPVPALAFTGPDGQPTSLAAFRGKTVLFNLWATWCAPCRHEMPALDRLQATLGGDAFQVVAVNIDTRNPDKPRQWLADNGIARLAYFSDPAAKTFQELKSAGKAFGMPTTLIVDRDGCELGVIAGPADWAGEDALRLLRAAIGRDRPS